MQSSDPAELNHLWGCGIIDTLIQSGVKYFCIAPGSRSTPLTLAVASHSEAEAFVHFDERSLAFHALGYALITKKPVVVIVSSGTAGGHLLPSIMEAYHSHIPLIVLTADRPPELLDTGANQATDQYRMFTNFVNWETSLPCPTDSIPLNYLRSTLQLALSKATCHPKGPVHLNCMFREPLYASQPFKALALSSIQSFYPHYELDIASIEAIAALLSQHEKGVIVLGYNSISKQEAEVISFLSQKLQFPVFADIASGAREHLTETLHFDLILKSPICFEKLKPSIILHIGGQLTSKKTQEWLTTSMAKAYLHINSSHDRVDPFHLQTHRIVADIKPLCDKLLTYLPAKQSSSWMRTLSQLEASLKKALAHYSDSKMLSESTLFQHLSLMELPYKTILIGSSMPIRDADMLFFPSSSISIKSLRGLSGIDGLIATSAGIACGLKEPLLTVIGDLTALHDISSLSQLKDPSIPPLTLLVINNQGGGIFSFLPIAKATAYLEKYFATEHQFDFKKLSEAFDVQYELIQKADSLSECLSKTSSKHRLIEVQTQRSVNVKEHLDLYSYLQSHLDIEAIFQEELSLTQTV